MVPGCFSCGLLALPLEYLLAQGSSVQVVHRHPSAGSLRGNVAMFCMTAIGFAFVCVRVSVCVCVVCVCVCARVCVHVHTVYSIRRISYYG